MEQSVKSKSEQLQTVAKDCGYTPKMCVRMINMIKKQMKETKC